MRVLGLMSGTSADGVDAVLAEFKGRSNNPKWQLLNMTAIPYPSDLRKTIIDVGQGLELSSKAWLELSEFITEVYFQAIKICDPNHKAELVGCHGQTVWHKPPEMGLLGSSLQLFRAPLLASLTNRPVIYDFRSADLALGGHGAPLVPKTDEALLGRVKGWRAILNIGGIANLTLIPPKAGPDSVKSLLGWDCGPGNSLIDLAMNKISDGTLFCDQNGNFAASGSPEVTIINKWLKEPFFNKTPPKSTGRDQFGIADLEYRLIECSHMSHENCIATITAFSAAVVAQDLDHIHALSKIRPIELLVAGGGANNSFLYKELGSECKGIMVKKIEEYGIPVGSREALCFAMLAWWHVCQFPGNVTSITGATREAVLGVRVNPA